MNIEDIWKKMQELLKYQDEKGLFPTIGQRGNTKRELQSTLLHTFVLEYLLDHHSEEEAGAIQRGLDFLISHAVNENGVHIWQWLKNPPREEDYRPPDTDDTMRARLVIEKALQKGFSVPKEFENFDYEAFLHSLMVDDGSVRTYIRDRHSGSCPIVNTNILYALTSIRRHDQIRDRIRGYLERVTDSASFDPNVFIGQSRYYLSALFPVYVLSKTIRIDPSLFSAAERKRILEYSHRVTPQTVLERAWKSSILRDFGGEFLATEISFDYIPIFRSKKLDEFYGSSSATAVFCFESNKLSNSL